MDCKGVSLWFASCPGLASRLLLKGAAKPKQSVSSLCAAHQCTRPGEMLKNLHASAIIVISRLKAPDAIWGCIRETEVDEIPLVCRMPHACWLPATCRPPPTARMACKTPAKAVVR